MNQDESILLRCSSIVKQMETRVIPKSLVIKTDWIKEFLIAGKHDFSVTGMLLASARLEHFKDRIPEWVKWADDNFELNTQDRSHRNKFGMLLLSIPEDNRVEFEILFKLDKDKSISISRFVRRENIDEVKPMELKNVMVFLAEHNVENMSREEVRDAVEEAITGKQITKPADKSPAIQPELPGFKESINNIFKNINQGSIKTFVETLSHDEAKKATSVAITCLNGVSAFYRKTGDYKNLTVEELNELEAYTIKLSRQFGTWRAELATTDPKAG